MSKEERIVKKQDENYCPDCGKPFKWSSLECPWCGADVKNTVSKLLEEWYPKE